MKKITGFKVFNHPLILRNHIERNMLYISHLFSKRNDIIAKITNDGEEVEYGQERDSFNDRIYDLIITNAYLFEIGKTIFPEQADKFDNLLKFKEIYERSLNEQSESQE